MDEELTRVTTAYILHDPVANVEGRITDFDPAKLEEAETSGMVIIAEDNYGCRTIVQAADVREPEPVLNGIKLVAPPYVDTRMTAVVDVFDALAAEMYASAPVVMSMTTEADAQPDTGFASALARLKELIDGGVANG